MPSVTLARRSGGVPPVDPPPKPAAKSFPFLLMADVEERDIRWLWKPYIPMGTVTMIFGHGGVGKSWLTAQIIAQITRAIPMPGEEDNGVIRKPMSVLIVAAEDDPAEVLHPRLRLLDADMSKVNLIPKAFQLNPDSIAKLEETIRLTNGAVVFIDPLVAYLGKEVDINTANTVRDVMHPLNELARRTGVAIIIVHHSRKGSGRDQQEAMGSADFINGPRSALHVQRNPEGKIMRHVKSNWAKNGPSITFDVIEGDDHLPRFVWGEVHEDAERPKFREPVQKEKASAYIHDALKDGPKSAAEMLEGAKYLGFNTRTLDRAKQGIAFSVKEAGVWMWHLVGREGMAPVPRIEPTEEEKALREARKQMSISLQRRSEVSP